MKSNYTRNFSLNKYFISTLALAISIFLFSCKQASFNKEKESEEIETTLNNWHKAATTADFDTYFNLFAEDGIFLGTDASETWDKETFMSFSKPHFENAPAWDFTPHDRNIYFSTDGHTAWFNELLDTWMDDCRGSGVLIKSETGWKITHYNLAILVPNEKVQDYLKVLHSTTLDSLKD